MADTKISKTEFPMSFEFNGESGRWTHFNVVDEETNELEKVLTIPRRTWEDLGEPDVVTVTIEPGDLLNTEVSKA